MKYSLAYGDKDDRTVALAAMIGAPSLVDSTAIRASIRRSENANEQYYALRAAQAAWANDLTSEERASILDAIERDDRDHKWISGSVSRSAIARTLQQSTRPPV